MENRDRVSQEEMSVLPKIAAIDFDGTLVQNAFPHIGEVIPETVELCRKLQEQGIKLILWTCRDGKNLEEALEVCEKMDLHFDAVNQNIPEVIKMFNNDTRKVFADIYIDDKCTDFGLRVNYWWEALGLQLRIEGNEWHLSQASQSPS